MKATNHSKTNETVSTIEAVREAFSDFRATRKKKGPLPAELWSSAVSLCSRHSVSVVSHALGLNYSDLRQRVDGGNGYRASCVSGMTFLDVIHPGKADLSGGESECSLEVRDQDGFSLKMQCRGDIGVNLVSLCRLIMDRR
jgi:hypothetical protein